MVDGILQHRPGTSRIWVVSFNRGYLPLKEHQFAKEGLGARRRVAQRAVVERNEKAII